MSTVAAAGSTVDVLDDLGVVLGFVLAAVLLGAATLRRRTP